MKNHKEYYAFISYKREDEKWAKWLQRKLENYKLPAVIRKGNTDIPKYIRPVFRDKTDLGGGVLSEQLRSELLNSKFLIAVCSPHATQSEWVNKEVQTFIDEGRAEQIVPFIVDGIPHADNPQEECFPKALLELPQEKELLGINVQEVGKEMAVVRLVATLLGLRFDTLWQRHRRRVVRRRINVGVIALLLFLIGLFVWDYNRPTYACFADYVDRYGVPEGVIPLTDEQVEKRNRCFLFEYRRIPFGEPNAYKWRVNKVSYVNSALRPQEVAIIEWKDRYPIMQMEYNEETGVASRINFCDVKGKVLLRHVLSERNGVPAAVADFIASREQQGTGFVGASLSSLSMGEMASGQNKASIVRYVYERNADGYIVRQTYHSNNDYQLSRSAVSDADGIFGKQYTLDSLGRRIRVDYLGFEGEKACTKKGVAGYSSVYEPHGNIQKTMYFNLQDSLVLNELMYAIGVCEVNSDGNVIEECYFDTDGNPCLNNYGYAKLTRMYDERGNLIEGCYFDTDGNPCLNNYGYAKFTCKYDARGNQIEVCNFDTDGNSCLIKDGYAQRTARYDERGNRIEVCYFDTDGNPCLSNDGYAKWTCKYDERGNQVENFFYDAEGNPCLINYGYARWTSKYDERGNEIERCFYDADGNPCLSNDGYARWTSKYDERGNQVENFFYDAEGNPCLSSGGYAQRTARYDERGNRVEACFYDADGNPCLSNYGYARWTSKYDERGNEIERCFYDADGNSCLSNDGYARWTSKYDERGNRVEVCSFDANGNLCKNHQGHSIFRSKYNDKGLVIEQACYDERGKPCIDFNGISSWIIKYDERGNTVEVCCFNTEGKPCLCNAGYSVQKINSNDRSQVIDVSYYDVDGHPVNVRGYFKETRVYDNRNKLQETIFIDKDGNVLAEQLFTRQYSMVSGAALNQGVPVGSIILQWNDWKLGDTQADFLLQSEKSRYGKKEIYYLTPSGKIGRLYVERGLMGGRMYDLKVEKSHAQEWLKQLEKWKKENKI